MFAFLACIEPRFCKRCSTPTRASGCGETTANRYSFSEQSHRAACLMLLSLIREGCGFNRHCPLGLLEAIQLLRFPDQIVRNSILLLLLVSTSGVYSYAVQTAQRREEVGRKALEEGDRLQL